MLVATRRDRRLRFITVGVVLLVAIAANGPPLFRFAKTTYLHWKINTGGYKRRYGHWINLNIPSDDQINAVHAVMLNTGKVLIMAGSGNSIGNFNAGRFESVVFNPANNTFKKIPTPYDMFCSGHFILPDGNVLIAGGVRRYEVLASRVRYAAGVMTVANHSVTRSFRLPTGTTFESATGQLYGATIPAVIPPARQIFERIGRKLQRVIEPSYTPLWVKAARRGQGAVSNTERNYSILGVPVGEGAALQASSFEINRASQNFWGSQKSYIFNIRSETYQRVSDLNIARWYPTLVGLKDGNVLAVSGLNQFGQIIVGNSEEFNPATGRWTLEPKLAKPFPTYPALFLMPNGDLFFTGANAGFGPDTPAWHTPGIWNPNTDTFRPVTKGLLDPHELQTAGSILLPPAQEQRYAVIGGGGVGESRLSTGRVAVVGLDSRDPRWSTAAYLGAGTRYPEVVITPSDGVMISGGSRYYRGMHGSDLMTAHMWMPSTGRMQNLADPLVARDYHAEGLLLPDGRILTLGGNPLFGNAQDTALGFFHKQISIYSPPYLFEGARPKLNPGPTSVKRGAEATFTTPSAGTIVKVRLMHPSAVTHVTDVQQRSIAVPFQREPGALRLRIPTGAGLVPSGWYMLFVTNRRGVPSVARWVHVS